MSDNYLGFKLVNGTEIIANLVEETDLTYVLENASYWTLIEVEPQKYDVQYPPLSPGAYVQEDSTSAAINIKLNKSAVMFPYKLRDEILSRYKQLLSPIILINP